MGTRLGVRGDSGFKIITGPLACDLRDLVIFTGHSVFEVVTFFVIFPRVILVVTFIVTFIVIFFCPLTCEGNKVTKITA